MTKSHAAIFLLGMFCAAFIFTAFVPAIQGRAVEIHRERATNWRIRTKQCRALMRERQAIVNEYAGLNDRCFRALGRDSDEPFFLPLYEPPRTF